MLLTSLQNPKLKALRSLHSKKGRKQAGQFMLETTKLVQEALQSRWPLEEVFATEEWIAKYGAPSEVPVTLVAERLFSQLVTTETPEGVVAVARLPRETELPEPTRTAFYVVADALQDPGNLGTIIRTADAVGASAVLVGPGTVDPYSPKVVRATMGSLFHLPVLVRPALYEDLRELKDRGVALYATALRTERSLYDLDLAGPLAWLVGNEGAGLTPEAVALATEAVSIPMPGQAESLNASVATSVCLYETLRQRLSKRVWFPFMGPPGPSSSL
ncbi:MAG TPA: RNA methyltransferase [Stenomitos sp.]